MTTVFRKRDLIVLIIIGIAIYLSLDSSGISQSLDPAWYIDQRKTGWTGDWDLVPPIVTDLDGNGDKEVVVITRDLKLKIFSAALNDESRGSIYIPTEISSVNLSPLNVQKGRAPIALKTGYIHPYDPLKQRHQVIVIVREDWSVSCYDWNLQLLWEKAIAHKSLEIERLASLYKIDEVAIFLSSLSLKEDSMGVVTVGASMVLRDPEAAGHVAHMEEGMNPDAAEEVGDETASHVSMELRAKMEHFSVYALDATDGHVIWRHDGTEVRAEQYVRSLPQHAYRLDLGDLVTQTHHAAGINDWTLFRQSLVAELPHAWREREDTSFRIAHFVRRHIGAGSLNQGGHKHSSSASYDHKVASGSDKSKKGQSSKKTSSSKGDMGRFTGVEAPPLVQSATLPHDAAEHTEHPNVLVAHTKKGIEIIALRTGAPITSLALAEGRTYADIDGDDVVDTVVMLETPRDVASHGVAFSHDGGELQHCSVMVVSGLPPRAQLFNGTVCPMKRNINDPLSRSAVGAMVPIAVSAASPVILKSVDPKTLRESKQRDLVVAVNTGVVTCYSGSGTFRWQVTGAPQWGLDFAYPSTVLLDSDGGRVDDLGRHDSAFSQILVMGEKALALISRDGELLTVTDLPSKPIARPILGDFDSDGVVDVMVVTEEAVLGFRLEVTQSVRGMLVVVAVLAVVALIIFLSSIRTIDLQDAAGGKRNVLSISRATDEYHID